MDEYPEKAGIVRTPGNAPAGSPDETGVPIPEAESAGGCPKETGAPVKMALDCGDGATLELVEIPAGTFIMGSPESEARRGDDEVQHRVTLTQSFYMGTHEVTQAQYRAIMGTNPSGFRGDNLPAERVSWEDAAEFCLRLPEKTGRTVRLPTEAEWEYACRAGTTTPFNTGSTISTDQANYHGGDRNEVYWDETVPVGWYPPNAWGLYDMHGNVLEWCSDWHGGYDIGNSVDPQGAATGMYRVVRGGWWDRESGSRYCRSAWRGAGDTGSDSYVRARVGVVGFRVAVSAAVKPPDAEKSAVSVSIPEKETAKREMSTAE
jgi:formylglycine-generating enzyme required for sulfatase activity